MVIYWLNFLFKIQFLQYLEERTQNISMWGLSFLCCRWNVYPYIRHCSHVTKNRFFKNLNLRRKADRNFRGNLLKNYFRHLKFYSNPPNWLDKSRCRMSVFWKTKSWSSRFWEGQPFRFCDMGIHRQRRLKSTKAVIFT